MPYKISRTDIREIDPNNAAQLKALAEDRTLSMDQYLQQFPPRTMPMMFEPEFTQKEFLSWAQNKIEKKYPGSHFRYGIVDHEFEPLKAGGQRLSFPFTFITLFDYKGKTYAGSFIGGHSANILRVKGKGHPEKHINVEEPYRSLFTVDDQQRLTQESLLALCSHPKISGVITAVPNRRGSKDPDLASSAFFWLMAGGHVRDQYDYRGDKFKMPKDREKKDQPNKPLNSEPVSFTHLITDDKEYVFFPMLGEDSGKLLSDPTFCRLCVDIRNLGPEYQRLHPERAQGTQYNNEKATAFVKRLVELGQPEIRR